MSIHKDLLAAFEQRNFGKFQEALEVFEADPNRYVKTKEKTIFEYILETPKSSNYIKLCVENGADFYMVTEKTPQPDESFLLLCTFHFCRRTTTGNIHCIMSSSRDVSRTSTKSNIFSKI